VALGIFAGYAFARFGKARFFRASLWALLLTRMTPALTLVLPFFICYRTLSLIDTRTGLIIAYSSFLLPLSAWMMRSYFEGVPMSLDRAALIDGCSWFGMMTRVLIPVVRPGIVAAIIFCFLASWNEFLFALILTGNRVPMITVVMAQFVTERGLRWNLMAATAVMALVPAFLIALFGQKYVIRGLRI
jgi:multiple sugar transport system permease protein